MPDQPDPPRRLPHDAAYKKLFLHPRTVADTLRGTAHSVIRHFELESLERLPASFVTRRLGQRHTDMLWRLRSANGDWLYLIVLLEFQSTVERRMARRMIDYTLGIVDSLTEPELGPHGLYPPVLPVVLYNGERRWTAPTDLRQLFAAVPAELIGYLPRHRYLVIDIPRLDPAALPADNAFAMITRLEQVRSATELERVARVLARWITRSGAEELLNEEKNMSTLIERARKWGEEERAQARLEGKREGMAEGRHEGMARGRLEGERAMAYQLVARRFGTATLDRLAALIESPANGVSFAEIVSAAVDCASADEFLARAAEAAGS